MHDHASGRAGNKMALAIALAITISIMVLEFIGGLVTNSLALLSDSGHMLSDTGSLALSLLAMWMASRPPSPRKSFGYYRLEILAAFLNGLTLFVIAGIIMWEAYGRFLEPPEVASGTMLGIAAVGLIANILSAFSLLRQGDVHGNINLRSAYLHVLGDALGSLGAIVAGLLMYFFSWYVADPIISVLVSLLILKSAWGIVDNSIHILMEGVPIAIDPEELKSVLTEIPGVKEVHDLHIWTITSGLDSLTCHLLVHDGANREEVLQDALRRCEEEFKIKHATIQVEQSQLQHPETEI